MINQELPKSWVVNRLGDFVLYQKGKKPKSLKKIQSESHQIAYVNIKAFEQGLIDEYTDGEGCVLCEDNDFLMVWDGSRSGYVGRAIKGALGSTLVRIYFPGVNLDYAYFFLQSKFLEINSRAKGTGIPHVDPDLVWNYSFPLPPLAEQHRIVAKIEELFSELDNGIETLKKAKQQLKIYRQAVLKYAFEGKLTNPDVKDGELPEGWELQSLGDIALKITDGEHITPKRSSHGVYLLSARNIQNGFLNLKNVDYIPEEEYQRIIKRCNPQENDILISCSGSIGRICRVPKNLKFTLVRSVALVKLDYSKYNSLYFQYLFLSPFLQDQIEKGKKATAQANLFLGPIKSLKVIIPNSIDEQIFIVQEVESRLSVCDKIEDSIEQGIKQAEALRQSILKKAFEGRLVPQDARDENASILLERIKAERVQAQPQKKTKVKKIK